MTAGRVNRARRGFLLQDSRITLDNLEANTGEATTSDYTQTGPRPGQAEPEDELGTYVPRAHNGQAVDLDLIALRAGIPDFDTGAGIAYREDGETATDYRGWSEPNLVTGFRVLEWSTSANFHDLSDAVTCPVSQKVVAVATDSGATLPPSSWVWDPATRTWGSRVSIDDDLSGGLVTIAVQRRTGRLLALRVETTGGSGRVYSSDDDGDSWQEYAPHAARNTTFSLNSVRICWIEDRNGVLLLLVKDNTTNLYQFASADGGATFQQVGTTGSFGGTGLTLALAANGNIVICYTEDADISVRVITDAYDLVWQSDLITALEGTTIQTVAVACDADGVLYATGGTQGADHFVYMVRSLDHGATWSDYDNEVTQLGGGSAGDAGDSTRPSAMAASGGELLMLFTSIHNATTPTSDGSLLCFVLGGWSSVEQADANGRRTNRTSWATNGSTAGSAIFLPDAIFTTYSAWVATGTAETISSGEHRFNPSAASSYVTLTMPGHTATPSVFFEARTISGGSLAASDCILDHLRRDGVNQYRVILRFDGTGFRVRDAIAGTDLGTVAVDITSQRVQILLLYGEVDVVTVLWKRYSDSVWTVGAQATLGSSGTALSTDVYQIGCFNPVTADFRVGLFAFTGLSFARGLVSDATGDITRMRWGKSLTAAPYPVRDQADADGRMLHLSGSGGVAKFHDTWDLPASYDYGIREVHVDESPKPTRAWRSTDTTEQTLTWDLGDNSRLGHSWAIGLCLVRPNFRRAILEVSTSAAPSTFTQIGEYNSRVVESSTFTRSGNLLQPGSAATPGIRYFGADELQRGFVTLDPSGTPVNRKVRKNEGGGWLTGGMRTALELTGVDGTEPTSGTLHVHAAGGVLVIHQSAPTAYRRVRLRIPAQECPDDYFELGGIVLGSIWVIGRQWSRGWSWRYVPIIREEEDDAGTIYVEPRAEEEDTYRRELTVAWQDGYSTGALRAGSPPYLSAGPGTPALAGDQDVWWQIVGLLRASRGGALPAVALLDIPQFTSTITDPTLWSYGRLGVGQSAQFNNVQGSEGRDELYRGESLTHVELVG